MTEGVSGNKNTFAYEITEEATEPITVVAQMEKTGNKVTFDGANVLEGEAVGGTVSAYNHETREAFTSGSTLGVDSKLTFTAAPADGYEVVGWKVNGEDVTEGVSTDKKTFTDTIPKIGLTEVQTVFDQIPYTVSWSAEGGTVTVTNQTEEDAAVTNGSKVRGGRTLVFTAAVDDGACSLPAGA